MKFYFGFLYLFVFSLILASCSNSKKAVINKSGGSIERSYSAKMGVKPSEIKNKALYKLINEWYGVPYKIGGTTKSGIDCSAFTGVIYRQIYKKNIPRTTGLIYAVLRKKRIRNLREGDLVFFNFNGKKNSHVGVYLQNGWFVHASTSKGVMLNSLNQDYYKKHYSKGGSVTGQ